MAAQGISKNSKNSKNSKKSKNSPLPQDWPTSQTSQPGTLARQPGSQLDQSARQLAGHQSVSWASQPVTLGQAYWLSCQRAWLAGLAGWPG